MTERNDPLPQINSAASPVEPFDLPEANLIIRSSDLVDFRIHKPVLAMASPFFEDLLSHSDDSEFADGLSVVQLSEDSELLNCLISILYPVGTVIPKSHEKVLYLLATCHAVEIPNYLLLGASSTRGMSEIRYGFGTVVYSCRGQPRSISSAIGNQGLLCIRNC